MSRKKILKKGTYKERIRHNRSGGRIIKGKEVKLQ